MNVNAALEGRTFGELLRRARVERALTQRQAADIVGVTPVTVSRWESNQSGVVQRQHRLAVARFLDISEKQLYEASVCPGRSRRSFDCSPGVRAPAATRCNLVAGLRQDHSLLSRSGRSARSQRASRQGRPLRLRTWKVTRTCCRAVELLPGGAGSPTVDS